MCVYIFSSHSVWIGTDIQKFNQIRDVLKINSIPYKNKAKDYLSELNGRGTHRSSMGNSAT